MLHAPHFARDMGVKDIREAAFASSNQAREKMEGTEERGRDDIQTSRRLDEDSEADDLEIIVCRGQGEGARAFPETIGHFAFQELCETEAQESGVETVGVQEQQLATNQVPDHPSVRWSTRVNAGKRSNPHHLPGSVVQQHTATRKVDWNLLNSVVQTNLLVMQLLTKNNQA